MAETISMPKLGFDMSEGTLIRWVKREGEQVTKGEVLAEIETDKATVEVESSASGVVRRLLTAQGEIVPVGMPIAIIGSADEKLEEVAVPSPARASSRAEPAAAAALRLPSGPEHSAPVMAVADGAVKASPLARKIAREASVDLSRLQGTGPGGRIVRKDVEALMGAGGRAPRLARVLTTAHGEESVPLSKLRQAIGRRMAESKVSAPHFYVTHEYAVDALLELRRQLSDYLSDEEKPSLNDFVVRAVALTLREFPNLNASFAGAQTLRHGAVNVGVAVAVEGGLLTIVARDADQKPLRQIASEVKAMVGRARAGRVKPEDIEGSTFSVSNLGMYDVENFIAILNPPEAAILAVGSARELPVIKAGQIVPGWRMKATLSVDHRVSDGAEAARFLQAMAGYLENPARLLL